MAAGEEITVARVADAAGISRATAYRYFSEPAMITAEVTLDLELMSTEELLKGMDGARARAHEVARYYLEFTREHEAEFRSFLAQTMRQWKRDNPPQLREARRIGAFSMALEPVRPDMASQAFSDLVLRLSMLTGLEQLIAMHDVLRLDVGTGMRLQAEIVDAVLDRYLPTGE